MQLTETQERIIQGIDSSASTSRWTDWKWQMQNRIVDRHTFARLLHIEFTMEETMLLRPEVNKTPFLDIHGETLGDVFGMLVDELLRITEKATIRDNVEVIDL